MRKYSKAIVAVAGVCATLGVVGADGQITAQEAVMILEAIAVAAGVFQIRNRGYEGA